MNLFSHFALHVPHLNGSEHNHLTSVVYLFITSVFINPDTGDVYKENEILKRPQLANTLRVLQDDPDALYTGQLANQLAEDIQGFGGIITAEDLRNYKFVFLFTCFVYRYTWFILQCSRTLACMLAF